MSSTIALQPAPHPLITHTAIGPRLLNSNALEKRLGESQLVIEVKIIKYK